MIREQHTISGTDRQSYGYDNASCLRPLGDEVMKTICMSVERVVQAVQAL